MKIALFAGVHGTDQDALTKTLLRNADMLAERGTAVPAPGTYRDLLTAMLDKLAGRAPAVGARDVVLDAILSDSADDPDRLVLCCDAVLGPLRQMFSGGQVYPAAMTRLASLRALFEGERVELFLALSNPATLLPDLAARSGAPNVGALLAGMPPEALRWPDLLDRLQRALPGVPITVWCTEDTPFIWGEALRAVAGLPSGARIAGAFDVLAQVMEPEGMRRFRAYLGQHPDVSEAQKYRIMAAFLDKYAMDEALETAVDAPGWDAAYVDRLTATYESDLDVIAELPGVRFIAP